MYIIRTASVRLSDIQEALKSLVSIQWLSASPQTTSGRHDDIIEVKHDYFLYMQHCHVKFPEYNYINASNGTTVDF